MYVQIKKITPVEKPKHQFRLTFNLSYLHSQSSTEHRLIFELDEEGLPKNTLEASIILAEVILNNKILPSSFLNHEDLFDEMCEYYDFGSTFNTLGVDPVHMLCEMIPADTQGVMADLQSYRVNYYDTEGVKNSVELDIIENS